MPELKNALSRQIENEIQDYFGGLVNISPDYDFSQPKLIRRISLFENHIYPTGKTDSQGNYKYFYDIQTPRVNAEIKNTDFDTKNVEVYSERKIDALPVLITNLKLREYMRTTGQAEEINAAIEEGAGWGNIVWKKVKGSFERVDLKNFYVINQTAKTLDESTAIERHQMNQSDLRAKNGTYKYVDEVIKECKANTYSATPETQGKETTTPYYEIYEHNGEVCVYDLKEYRGEKATEADRNKYVLAKVIGAGKKSDGNSNTEIKYILFAEELGAKKMSDIYKEYHRGRYKGRWFREGIIELLFDLQVRANEIGNQLARGLEWASKTIFTTDDKLIVQNVLTDLANGDIIRSKGITQVSVVMQGFTELANEWNRLIQLANDICNSQEVVQGITPASGTPLGTTQLLNQNAGKIFDYIREKIAIPLSEIFEQWMVPELIKDLKARDVLRLTGDSVILDRLYNVIVDSWYIDNLVNLPPHTKEIADALKAEKLDELKKRPQLLMTALESVWEGFKPNVSVVITGENLALDTKRNAFTNYLPLEADPIRRQALVEEAMRLDGIDVGGLPKSTPEQLQPIQPSTQIPAKKELINAKS